MNKLKQVFQSGRERLLSIYFTAGYPTKDSIGEILVTLEKAKVDFVEVGIPYSDPLCDGPTIQASGEKALANGIKVTDIFDQLEASQSSLPIVMMGYFNPVLQFGIERFCERCHRLGIHHVILPDLPIELYNNVYRSTFNRYLVDLIFLVTPQTTPERIREIDDQSSNFIYAVSTSSTTGSAVGIQGAETYLDQLAKMNLKTDIMVGFNIATNEDLNFVSRFARGGIIGSAFIKQLSKEGIGGIPSFIETLKA